MKKNTEKKTDVGVQKDSSNEMSVPDKDDMMNDADDGTTDDEKEDVSEEDVMDAILGTMPIPEEDQPEIRKIIGMSMQMGRSFSPEVELMKKMTPEHLTDFFEIKKQAMQSEFQESKDTKRFLVVVLILFLAFIIILVVLLKDKPDILEKVLYTLGGLVTGVFGGYGLGKTRSDE